MKSYLIPIKNDLFDIAGRLKEIDGNFRVYYNCAKSRFETRREIRGRTEFAFVVPYDKLDARTVEYALKTKAENIEKLAAEIDAHNEKTEMAAERAFREKVTESTEVKK